LLVGYRDEKGNSQDPAEAISWGKAKTEAAGFEFTEMKRDVCEVP